MSSDRLRRRHTITKCFRLLCAAVAWAGIVILAVLLFHVTREGIRWLDLQFLTEFPSRFPEQAGIKSALWGTVWLITLTAGISIPVGLQQRFIWKNIPRRAACHG